MQLVGGKESTYVDFSGVISAAVNFLIVAAVVHFVIVAPLRTIQERRRRGQEAGPAGPTDIELLAEIRDLLADRVGPDREGTGPEGTGRAGTDGECAARQSPPRTRID